MSYILKDNIALRTWTDCGHALIYKGDETRKTDIGESVFKDLMACDGISDSLDSAKASTYITLGYIEECMPDEKSLTSWQQHRQYGNHYIPIIKIAITERCNFNCLHCFNAEDNNPIYSELTYGKICDLIDQAYDLGIQAVSLTGGEPMMHPDFMEIVEYIYKKNMHLVELCTNGWFISEDILNRFHQLGVRASMKISFDGVGFHDWMRNKNNCEEHTLEKIRLCIKMGFKPGVHFNLNHMNVSCADETLDLLDRMGVDFCKIIPTAPSPRWKENSEGMMMTPEEYLDSAIKIVNNYIYNEDRRMKLHLWKFLVVNPRLHVYSFCSVHKPEHYDENKQTCKAAPNMLAVSSNGNVYPCLQLSGTFDNAGIGALGNIGIEPLLKIIEGDAYSEYFRKQCVGSRCKSCRECIKCPHLKRCRTGTVCISLAYGGQADMPDIIQCTFFKKKYDMKTSNMFNSHGCNWRNGFDEISFCK